MRHEAAAPPSLTSPPVLGKTRPPFLRPFGPIYQSIDVPRLRAKNQASLQASSLVLVCAHSRRSQETWPFFNSVTALLTPVSKTKVNVQFATFRIFGVIPITAPEAAKGSLDTTYVDETIRISRGDKGNLFILTMAEPRAELSDRDFESAFSFATTAAVAKGVREFN